MKDFPFLAGLVFGTVFSIACFLHGTNRSSADLVTGQVPVNQERLHYATGEFTRP